MEAVPAEMLRLCKVWAQGRLASAYYLAGGTALALQLGHRTSVDLDWFSRQPDERIPVRAIAHELEHLFGRGRIQPIQRQIDQATWLICNVRFTVLAYPFPLLDSLVPGKQVHRDLEGVWLASPREIAWMKAYALGRRASFRDYVDLYFLLSRGVISLKEIVDGASRKFVLQGRSLFNGRLFLEQLVYLGDLEDVDVTLRLVGDPLSPDRIQAYLREEVAAYVRREVERGPAS